MPLDKEPLMVTVVIPTYNRAQLVGRAVASVLDQTYQGFELIVVDDASTDETEQVVEGFCDPRIQYVRHDKNKGGSAARNTGIELSQGRFIALLDSDDEWLPGKLLHQIDVFQQAAMGVGLVYSDFLRVYPNGREKRHRPIAQGISIGYPSRWLVKREVFAEVRGFDESMPAMQDTEISIRIRDVWSTLYDPVVVMKYYVTKNSVSRSAADTLCAVGTLIERYAEVVTDDELSHWYMLLGKAYLAEGQAGSARLCLARAALLRPFETRHYGAFLSSMLGGRAYMFLRRLKRLSLREDLP